ncbi:PorP/SprF family type IX secretion system membrane protein [Roseimarinus sediminis]|uniref:PorP/SprF family type IX secretion system membrane protein n=1 Tax=Roseimarinus sediminis TaxID=1610899 RepID=UPI003D258676
MILRIRSGLFLTIMLVLASSLPVPAQTEPMLSQYMFGVQAVNPAYAGSWDYAGLSILARNQWIELDQHPQTAWLSFHTPLAKKKAGLGFTLMNDQFGMLLNQSLFVDYAYAIKVNRKVNLRLGLSGGMLYVTNNFTDLKLIDVDDPVFTGMPESYWKPNFGVGTYLHSDRFYAGFSIPRLLNTEAETGNNQFELKHLLAMGGFVIPLSDGIDMKPSCMVRYWTDAPMVTDFNLSFLLASRFWMGAMLRTGREIGYGFNANLLLARQLRIGYAYDLSNMGGLSSFAAATHEIVVSFEFRRKEVSYVSPRYF